MQVLRLVAKVNIENFYRRKYDLLYLDTCYGDSGGPLMKSSVNGQWILVGITSGGYACGHAGTAGVYTRVSSYSDWIRETISTYDPFGDPVVIKTEKINNIPFAKAEPSTGSQCHSSPLLLIAIWACLSQFYLG